MAGIFSRKAPLSPRLKTSCDVMISGIFRGIASLGESLWESAWCIDALKSRQRGFLRREGGFLRRGGGVLKKGFSSKANKGWAVS